MKVLTILIVCVLVAACQSASTVSVKSEGKLGSPPVEVDGLLFRPEQKEPRPAVVLLHTCGGLTPHVRTDWPDYLTSLGYVVFTVDTLSPRDVSLCTELPRGGSEASAKDAVGALDYLATLPFVDAENISVVGFSMGAIAINTFLIQDFLYNANKFRAGIGLYGHCRELRARTSVLREMKISDDMMPLLEIAGSLDEQHAPSCVDAAELSDKIETVVLPDVYHAFDQPQIRSVKPDPGGSMMLYDHEATMQARQLVAAFLARHRKR